MLGLTGRRTALARSKCLLSTSLPARSLAPSTRNFHSTPANATRPTWMPMRVKTPWIDALTASREAKKAVQRGEPTELTGPPDLTPKKMSDSYYSAVLSLAQDKWLCDEYLNSSGHIRLGSLLMDLDAMAGIIALRHSGDQVTNVTAAVDRITIENPLMEICDLELSGQVTYATGRSSMEVSLQIAKARPEGEPTKPEDVLITCAITMVSLDPITKHPAAIAPLIVETAEEKRLFKKGEDNYNAKKALRKRSLLLQAPDDEESSLIHSMWQTEKLYHDPNVTDMVRPRTQRYTRTTALESTMIMQPQYRNRHNFMIFGGFLLKQSFELAFCCAANFSQTRPNFLALDPSTFENPVPVGSVLYLRATIVFTEPEERDDDGDGESTRYTKVQVRVDTRVKDVEHEHLKPAGCFNYTFLVEGDFTIMPKSYTEFMLWVESRRRANNATAIDPLHKTRALRAIKDSVTE
ncbi:hypothetical protein N7495_000520 [Penicillium taxi]|uniref:uncharacterized protein n=1 Tax=Penicillium taxi TaxID=168475 RepID=UPI002545825E|nr:uncharacterized protein N7495_000520 [Penicillium taxi]KAJ5907838.1 hypothetical protein N7495_000520 [Penicillium taxi]